MNSSISKYDVILTPVITEKATDARADMNKFTFFVDMRANKVQIKDAVEKVFNVDVISVNTQKVKSKSKRLGRYSGKTSQQKKAVVTLKPGDRIKIMEGP